MKALPGIVVSFILLGADSVHQSPPPVIGRQGESAYLIAETSSPEFEHLVAQHRRTQQFGYTNVLFDEVQQDSLGALISFIKSRLHSLFSLRHTQLVKVIPVPQQEISTPIVVDYSIGYIVIEWKQIKLYRRVDLSFNTDPWEKHTR
jgi:hypothetical protein